MKEGYKFEYTRLTREGTQKKADTWQKTRVKKYKRPTSRRVSLAASGSYAGVVYEASRARQQRLAK